MTQILRRWTQLRTLLDVFIYSGVPVHVVSFVKQIVGEDGWGM
jgi:hypothetical protein